MKGADIPLADVDSLSNNSKKNKEETGNLLDKNK